MASPPDELTLVERVILRVGAAETDDQLQNVVSKFLPPVLLKLSSQQDGVRKKVMELLVHINKRIRSRPLIQLPVEALLVQYQDPAADSFVTNFTIIYIKMGYPRLPKSKQAELLPSILHAMEGKPQTHRDSLLLLLMPVLGNVGVPRDPEKVSAFFGLSERPQVAKELTDFMLDILILPYGFSTQPAGSQPNVSLPVPLGMSEYGFKRVTSGTPVTSDELEQIKLGIVKFVSHGVFPDSDILIHLVVAAADTRFHVARAAESELMKIVRGLDWSSPLVTAPLYHLFLGTRVFNRKFRTVDRPELCRQPVGTRIRLKIMPYIAKARGPAVIFPACVQVLLDALYGTETHQRLKVMALQYFTLDILPSNPTCVLAVGSVVLQALLKVIMMEEASLKMSAYDAVGKLVQRVPELVTSNLPFLQRMFDAVAQEERNTGLHVYHVLMGMLEAFRSGVKDHDLQIIQGLLAKQLESQEHMARLAAVHYLQTVFPSNHAPSRYLLLLVTCDPNMDVRLAALHALYSKDPDNYTVPSFVDMVNIVTAKLNYGAEGYSHPSGVEVFVEVVMFLIMCAVKGAKGCLTSEMLVKPRPTKWTPLVGRYLKELREDATGKVAVDKYLELLEQLAVVHLSVLPMDAMLDVVATAPELLCHRLSPKLSWLKSWLLSPAVVEREAAAQLYGAVAAYSLQDAEFDDRIADLIVNVNGKTLEAQHGCALALAHALERRITLLKKKGETDKIATWQAYREGVDTIVSLLDHQNVLLHGGACNSIGELARCFALPVPAGSSDVNTGKLDILNKLQSIANNPKIVSKVKEDAVMAMGFLCVGETFPHRREVIQGLLDLGKNKDLEFQLTVGEALVCCILGSAAPHARDAWCVTEEDFEAPSSPCADEDVEWFVLELINKMAPSTHPSIKQASCVWLLAVLKHCGHQVAVQRHLQSIQKTFMHMLGENNDVIQEAASKGLSFVYESSDEEARNLLMSELLDQLTQGRRSVLQVSADTKLFEEGQLGKSPTGGNLSTYKELCDLVTDLNQPELIYKFLHLANHSALWDSKKGAAFGFSAIAASAGEQLSEYLPKIVPRLYRYQYDPTPKIQKSMTSIWGALVREPRKAIEQYYSEILSDLLTNLTNPQWRVRISCCLGLSDLLRGGYNKSMYDCIEQLPEMWKQLFRVMDDIHEGTRQAATNTAHILSKLTIRACEATQGKSGETVLKTVLPVLLKVGICNAAAEVRAMSLKCVSELVGSAGKLLQPHLVDLIPALLQATSELELRDLSQLSVGMSASQENQEHIDSLRASVAKSHYTTETAAKCVQYIDAGTLDKLVPRIIELIRGSVGFGTRIACAHLIVLLAQHMKLELQPYAGKLLTTMVNALLDRNPVIRKNYAITIGYFISSAKESSVEKLLIKLRSWYFEKEDEGVQDAIALTFQSMAYRNQELVKEYPAIVVPLVFLAMHATKVNAPCPRTTMWEDVWSQITSGTESGIRQNLTDIVSVLKEALESSSWTMKAQAARAVATVASKVGTSVDSTTRRELVSILVDGLTGRTWNGKENLLQAIASICVGCKEEMKQEDCSALVEAVLRECRKDQLVYRQFALQAIGDILVALELDYFNDVYVIVEGILSKEPSSESNKDGSAGENAEYREKVILLHETAYEALGKSWPADGITQLIFREKLLEKCVSCLPATTRGVQVAVVSALRAYVDRLTLLEPAAELDDEEQESLDKIISLLKTALMYSLGVAKHTKLKKEALNVLYVLIKKVKEAQLNAVLVNLAEAFQLHLEEASKDNTPEIKSRVVDIQGLLKS